MTPLVKLRVSAVLFDLDGTLVDSAPDLAGAANEMRLARGLQPLAYDSLRAHAGTGARGHARRFAAGPPGRARLRSAARRVPRPLRAAPAAGDAVVRRHRAAARRARPPWHALGHRHQQGAAFCAAAVELARAAAACRRAGRRRQHGHTKPHPAPLLEAARRLGLPPQACVYVGDDLRDMHAGRAAAMGALAAAWGYLGVGARRSTSGAPISCWPNRTIS